jgi:hypothetical protein
MQKREKRFGETGPRVAAWAIALFAALAGCEVLFPVDKFMGGDVDAATTTEPDASETAPRTDAAVPDATLPDAGTVADAAIDSAPPDDGSVQGDSNDGAPLGPSVACDPFQGVAGMVLTGDSRSLPLGDGGAIWVVDQATFLDGGFLLSPQLLVGPGAAADCSSWTVTFKGPSFGVSTLAPNGLLTALDLVQASDGPALYYQLAVPDAGAPLGLQLLGTGLAPLDPDSGRFAPTSNLLWSPSRPAYGGSAMRVGSLVYVYGCTSNGGFGYTDCFVARADASALASTTAYTYWTGSGWSATPDAAMSIVQGGSIVSVRPNPAGGGYVMTYVAPLLGSTLFARTATAPEGPWSSPTTLGACDLAAAGAGAFCWGGEQHPELSSTAGRPLVLTYDARTFATDGGPDAAALSPRLVGFSAY